MRYCYKCKCGHQFMVSKPATLYDEQEKCPRCDTYTERDYAAESAAPATAKINASNQYPYVSSRLPKNLEGCQTDQRGKTVIESRSHEREIMAKYGYRRD